MDEGRAFDPYPWRAPGKKQGFQRAIFSNAADNGFDRPVFEVDASTRQKPDAWTNIDGARGGSRASPPKRPEKADTVVLHGVPLEVAGDQIVFKALRKGFRASGAASEIAR